jgi:hypothetical protein
MLERHLDKAQTPNKIQEPIPLIHTQNTINYNPIKLRIQILNQRKQDNTIDEKDSLNNIFGPII